MADQSQELPGDEVIAGKTRQQWVEEFPLIRKLMDLEPTSWFASQIPDAATGLEMVGLSEADIQDAADRLYRFAPYLAEQFPETRVTNGIIESPLVAVPDMRSAETERTGATLPGDWWAKLDSHLPISGSIKARGGIYEVLAHAEKLAIEHGLLPDPARTDEEDLPSYTVFASEPFRELFSRHRIAVGSTGNLGLSIGIMAANLGFQASVHMSADAAPWKKAKLAEHGVEVVEYDSDYSVAVAAGREQAASDPAVHFVDDENSVTLFLGYAVAGARTAAQLRALDVRISERNPLFVYLPCGVGGGPGGVAFGLKAALGDAVRCIFVEPTHSPAMLLGLYTGAHDALAVQDFGIDNRTAADGLAVGRPSGFVGRRMAGLIDGCITVEDETMFTHLAQLAATEEIFCEPSSAAAFSGPGRVEQASAADYLDRLGLSADDVANSTHLMWVTGGSMVPEEEMAGFIARG